MSFRIDLDVFRGPLDLMLYLVKKDELDLRDIPLASVTDQFLGYLDVLQELNIGDAGEFLEMASYLIELKSKLVLPHPDEEASPVDDPRADLVERLLEYKKFKDAAAMLEDRRRDWQQRYSRLSNDLPPRRLDPADQPIREVEMWDLVSAFGRIMRDSRPAAEPSIVYDDTPITSYMQAIHARIISDGRASFSNMFEAAIHKSGMIGVFLAILELARHHGIVTKQDELHGEIWIYPGESFKRDLDLSDADTYDHGAALAADDEQPNMDSDSTPATAGSPSDEANPNQEAATADESSSTEGTAFSPEPPIADLELDNQDQTSRNG